jgi:protoporphyrinogen/coproporphyrinogen III oxidase
MPAHSMLPWLAALACSGNKAPATGSRSYYLAQVDAGVADQLVMGDPTAPRFVFWKNKLRATPSSPISAVFGDFLSFLGKIRAGLGAVGLFKGGPMPQGKEESVKEFISRNLGPEVFFRLIEPFCSGVYAGNPEKLSMKAAFGRIHVLEEKGGSLVGGALKLMKEKKANPGPPRDAKLPPKPAGATVGSFASGLQTLPKAIADKVGDRVVCDWKLTSIAKGSDGLLELSYETPDGAKTIRTRLAGLTAPSYVVADLLKGPAPGAADALGNIDYPPVCAVTLAYPESAIKVCVAVQWSAMRWAVSMWE